VTPFRRNLVWSALAGLFIDGLLATLATWLVTSSLIRPPLPQPLIVILLAVMFGGISLVEIPLMIFGLRRLAIERPSTRWLVPGLNAVYVSFAGVYGTPVLVLTGSLACGWILCGLGLVRAATALFLVQERVQEGQA
jgi:hypothetical protein